jgi:hypothetical protein
MIFQEFVLSLSRNPGTIAILAYSENFASFFSQTMAGLISRERFHGDGNPNRTGPVAEDIHGPHVDGVVNFVWVGVPLRLKESHAASKNPTK